MGYERFDSKDWSAYSDRTKTMSTDKIYSRSSIDTKLDPKSVTIRESRDSAANPQSTPIAMFLDVTGSMGVLADNIAKKGLGVTFQGILDRKPVTDPHLLVGGIGDIRFDRSPLQVTEFETGVPAMTAQIEKIYLEHGGGNNQTESYDLAWWFAGSRTVTDAWEKRKKKGYLFTIGDENAPTSLPKSYMDSKVSAGLQSDLLSSEALEMAQRQWEVFHILVEQGSHCRRAGVEQVRNTWIPLLGQNVICLSNVDMLGEVIVSAIEVAEGRDAGAVAASWGGGTDLVVAHAVKGIVASGRATGTGVVRL
jgi:hypothetical protein